MHNYHIFIFVTNIELLQKENKYKQYITALNNSVYNYYFVKG